LPSLLNVKLLSLYNPNTFTILNLMNITIVGTGYVGLSLAVLLAQNHNVSAIDIDQKKIDLINKKISPIDDPLIKSFLSDRKLKLSASRNYFDSFKSSDYILICTPTDYNPNTNEFDVSSVENVINDIQKINTNATVVIKSTVPVGFTEKQIKKFSNLEIIFSPEFLREGNALYDNMNPSRIIIGSKSKKAVKFSKILLDLTEQKNRKIPIEFMNSNEAEAVKLFSNTYLAMRIAFFNEVDSYCEIKKLNSANVINGISYDNRIGNYYNNPSFGYGGYCLPKDTQQLLKNYAGIPNKLMQAIVDANFTRKDFIVNQIIKLEPKVVGIYRLVMKLNSDNFRESAVQGVISGLKNNNVKVVIFEPQINETSFLDNEVINDFSKFISISDLIVANRNSGELKEVMHKVYTRDLFGEN